MAIAELPEVQTPVDEIDLSDFVLWSQPDAMREAVFRKLRTEKPVSFHPEPEFGNIPAGPGYWALTTYDDVTFASRHPDLFCSGQGSNIGDMPTEIAELFGSMINMDSPKHTKLRLLVNKGFTPRMVARIEDYVHDVAREIVRDIKPKGEVDFVTEVAAPMPLRIICDMMGIPRSDNEFVFDKTNHILGGLDEEYNSSVEDIFNAGWALWEYAQALGTERLANPQDDITTSLMQADVDGARLTAAEFGSFFVLLVVAGNETTRNAIAHGLLELSRNPDQRAALLADPETVMPTAVEEIVRWATPVIHFRRTATEDVELPSGNGTIKAGEKVVLFYGSANRDERFWDDPYRFDVRRTPNEHVGFGGGGPHFCLGANLARREIRVMFEELFRELPDIEVSGEPAMLQSNFIHGIKHLTATFTAR
ncbi:MAG: methyl-branched lipid omega-hydroxylase [Acidimicrobiaceae bacterium]